MLLQLVLVLGNANTATTAANSTKLGGKDANQYTTNDRFAVVNGQVTLTALSSEEFENKNFKATDIDINFPNGFNKDNSIVIALGAKPSSGEGGYAYGNVGELTSSMEFYFGCYPRYVVLGTPVDSNKIRLRFFNFTTSDVPLDYKLVLMKIS